jgi:PAS domain S-box-containing protein
MQSEELIHKESVLDEADIRYKRLYRNYAVLFNFAPIGYLTINRDGVINDINLAGTIMLNAPRSTLIGHRITDFLHHDDQDGFYYQKLLCQKQENAISFELKLKRADGSLFDARLQMQQLSAEYGEEPKYSVTLMDISDHVRLSSSYALQQRCLEIASTADDLRSLLQAYVQTVKDFLKCDAMGIRLRDQDENIPYQAYDGFSQAFYESESPLSLHTDQCLCIRVINQMTSPNRLYCTPQGSFYINGTSRLLATVSPEELGKTRNVCNAHGYESVALVPIPIDTTVEGLIHVADRRENAFPLRIVEILETVGARLGLAIQRFQLQAKLNETVDILQHLSSCLLTAQEDEQRRIAMELHDGCGQDLNVLKLRLKGLQKRLPTDTIDLRGECDQLLAYTDKIINDIRNLAHGLKPAALDVLGLSAAARQIIREFSSNTGIQVEMELSLLDGIKDPKVQVCLFRIFQETLTNITKHARASWVAVTAEQDDQDLRIRIQDDGTGFNQQSRSGTNGADRGMGLSAMALRCRMIGANFCIDSAIGRGTRVTVSVPCSPPEAIP